MDLVAQAVERNAEAVEENDMQTRPGSGPRLKSATCSRNSGLENEDDLTYELLHDDVGRPITSRRKASRGRLSTLCVRCLRWT